MPPAYKQVSDAELDQAAAAYRQVSDEELDRAAAGVGPAPAPAAPTVWNRLAAARSRAAEGLVPKWGEQDIPFVSAPFRAAANIVTPIPTSPIEAATLPLMLASPAARLAGGAATSVGRGLAALFQTAPRRVAAQAAAGAAGGALGAEDWKEGALTGGAVGGASSVFGEGIGQGVSSFLRYGPGALKRVFERGVQEMGRATEKIAPTLPKFRSTEELVQAVDVGKGGATGSAALSQAWQAGMDPIERAMAGRTFVVPAFKDQRIRDYLAKPAAPAGMDVKGVSIPDTGEVTLAQANEALKLLGSAPSIRQDPQNAVLRAVHDEYRNILGEIRTGIGSVDPALVPRWQTVRKEWEKGKNVKGLLERAMEPATAKGPKGYEASGVMRGVQQQLGKEKVQRGLRRHIGQPQLEELGEAATFGRGIPARADVPATDQRHVDWVLGSGALGVGAGLMGYPEGYYASAPLLTMALGRRFVLPNRGVQYPHAPGQLPYGVPPVGGQMLDLGLLRAIESIRSQQREEEPLP